MQLNSAIALREERAKLWKDMCDLRESTGLKTTEDLVKFRAMDLDLIGMTERIEALERIDSIGEQIRRTGAPPSGQPGGGADDEQKELREKYVKAYRNYLKYGIKEEGGVVGRMDEEERRMVLSRRAQQEKRDMGTGGQAAYPGATTGFFVPVGFVDRIEEALKYYGCMLNGGLDFPEIMPTDNGQPLPFPTDNDTTVSGELVGEGQQVTTQDVNIGQIILGAYKFSTKMVKVSIELLQDSAFDLESYLIKKFSTRLGRVLNTYMTVGSGANQPTGIITAATGAGTAVGAFSNDGESAANTLGSDDLTTLEHSVDPLYRPGAKYMFHDSTLAALKRVKDKYGRPLWMPGVAVGAPDTINGYGYGINNDMATLQASASSPVVTNITIAFGALNKFLIRRVKELAVLRLEERYADYGQIAFIGFARYDGNLLDAGTHPVKYLVNTY